MPKFTKYLFVSALIFGSALIAEAQTKDTAALEDLIRSHVNAQSSYDRAKLDSLVTADYIEISPVGEFDPRAKMLDFYKPELKPADVEVKHQLNEFSTRSYGNFGIVIVRIDYSMTKAGTALPSRSIRATFVCRKDGNAWKIASAHYTGIRQAPPPSK